MGKVQAALAGHQKFAAHGWLGLVQVNLLALLAQHFGGHQPGRSAADDRHRFGFTAHNLKILIMPKSRTYWPYLYRYIQEWDSQREFHEKTNYANIF